jgi:phosphoribosylformylglycinamidine synthase subunit PurS
MTLRRDCACLRAARKYREMMKAKVVVMPKAAVLDPQGNAVRDAMRHLGMPEVRSVRIGKYMEIDIEEKSGDIESRLHGLCRDLLSNPVIEDYQVQQSAVGGRTSGARSRKTPNVQRPTSDAQRRKTKIKTKRKRKSYR